MLYGSSTTWFQTSRYCRAKVDLIRSVEFDTVVARRLKQAFAVCTLHSCFSPIVEFLMLDVIIPLLLNLVAESLIFTPARYNK